MNENNPHLEALNDIRQMMKQSNRFLSLSGLSGVFAGLYALAGAWFGDIIINNYIDAIRAGEEGLKAYNKMIMQCILVSALVLGLSLATALYFSAQRAKKTGQKLFDHTAWRLVVNLMVPLIAGGGFCLAMLYHTDERALMVGPATLVFYGLALVNGSKYTLHDIRYLGYLEIGLGIIACFLPGFGLVFWAIGFGLLHIIYGSIMWYKYERNQ